MSSALPEPVPPPPPATSGDMYVEESSAGRGIGSFEEVHGDYTPRLGQEFSSDHEAYEFYQYYASKVGFTIRRRYANKSKNYGEISSRKFACSREGFKALDKRTNYTRTPQPDTRTE